MSFSAETIEHRVQGQFARWLERSAGRPSRRSPAEYMRMRVRGSRDRDAPRQIAQSPLRDLWSKGARSSGPRILIESESEGLAELDGRASADREQPVEERIESGESPLSGEQPIFTGRCCRVPIRSGRRCPRTALEREARDLGGLFMLRRSADPALAHLGTTAEASLTLISPPPFLRPCRITALDRRRADRVPLLIFASPRQSAANRRRARPQARHDSLPPPLPPLKRVGPAAPGLRDDHHATAGRIG